VDVDAFFRLRDGVGAGDGTGKGLPLSSRGGGIFGSSGGNASPAEGCFFFVLFLLGFGGTGIGLPCSSSIGFPLSSSWNFGLGALRFFLGAGGLGVPSGLSSGSFFVFFFVVFFCVSLGVPSGLNSVGVSAVVFFFFLVDAEGDFFDGGGMAVGKAGRERPSEDGVNDEGEGDADVAGGKCDESACMSDGVGSG